MDEPGLSKKIVTIAVPVKDEEANLPELFLRLVSVIEKESKYLFEVILIDNGSTDKSGIICKQMVQKNPSWKYVQFSRNFGIESSFLAGSYYAKGDALIYLFSDLQDPPETISQFLAEWENGYDVVYGLLTKREDQNVLKTFGAKIAYYLIYTLSDIRIPKNATDFRLISRPVIDAVNSCPEKNRYMRGLVQWAGFSQKSVPFERSPRRAGKSNAGLIFCIKYALSAIFAFSTKPLKLASFVGILATLASIFGAIFWVIITVLSRKGLIDFPAPPLGWTTMVLLIFFFGGIQCLFMGIIGEYISGVQNETKNRPLWIVRSSVGIASAKSTSQIGE